MPKKEIPSPNTSLMGTIKGGGLYLTPADRERLAKAAQNWDKPLTPPIAVPKSVPKKRGRPAKEEKE